MFKTEIEEEKFMQKFYSRIGQKEVDIFLELFKVLSYNEFVSLLTINQNEKEGEVDEDFYSS